MHHGVLKNDSARVRLRMKYYRLAFAHLGPSWILREKLRRVKCGSGCVCLAAACDSSSLFKGGRGEDIDMSVPFVKNKGFDYFAKNSS